MMENSRFNKDNGGHVYIMANNARTFLSTGVITQLKERVEQYRNGSIPGFTGELRLESCVYFEYHLRYEDALKKEQQIKKWPLAQKMALVKITNPKCTDLWERIRLIPSL